MKRFYSIVMVLCVVFFMSSSVYGRNLIQNKGSDTLVNVAQAWAEAYTDKYPQVNLEVSGGGSGVGLAGLQDGTVQMANASRDISKQYSAGLGALEFQHLNFQRLACFPGDGGTCLHFAIPPFSSVSCWRLIFA